ncbi:unnamed protein product, partial [Mesorhabditis spiculigera]
MPKEDGDPQNKLTAHKKRQQEAAAAEVAEAARKRMEEKNALKKLMDQRKLRDAQHQQAMHATPAPAEKKQETVRDPFSSILGTENYHLLAKAADLKNLKGTLNGFEASLCGSNSYSMYDSFRRAISDVSEHVKKSDQPLDSDSLLSMFLAWIARAAGCRINALLPPGEVFPEAEAYLLNLRQAGLPQVYNDSERPKNVSSKRRQTVPDEPTLQEEIQRNVRNTMDMLTAYNLEDLKPPQAALLLFALCRQGLSNCEHLKLIGVVEKLLDCEQGRQRIIMHEFAAIFGHLTQDQHLSTSCVRILRQAACGCVAVWPVLSSTLIQKTEREELAVTPLEDLSKEDYVAQHLHIFNEALEEAHFDVKTYLEIFTITDLACCHCVVALARDSKKFNRIISRVQKTVRNQESIEGAELKLRLLSIEGHIEHTRAEETASTARAEPDDAPSDIGLDTYADDVSDLEFSD